MELKKNIFLFVIIFLFIFSPSILANKPAENSLGLCDVWFSKDSVSWENTTTFANLKLGEPFYVKIWVKAKTDLKSVSYHISCYGPPYDFELLEKPENLADNAQLYDFDLSAVCDITFWDTKAFDEYTLVWKLRVKPDSDFINGNTPLNIDFEFFGEETKSFYFTIVSVNIINQTWVDYALSSDMMLSMVENNPELSHISLDFQIICIIILILMLTLLKMKTTD